MLRYIKILLIATRVLRYIKILLIATRVLRYIKILFIATRVLRHIKILLIATRVLRSATNNDLYVPPSRSRYGDRTFSVSAPRMWNALPSEMKTISCLVTFKRLLKPLLFRVAYAS